MDAVIIFSYIHGMREKLDLSNVIDITFEHINPATGKPSAIILTINNNGEFIVYSRDGALVVSPKATNSIGVEEAKWNQPLLNS